MMFVQMSKYHHKINADTKKAAIFMKNQAYWDSLGPKQWTSIEGSDTFVTKNQVQVTHT